MTTNFNPLIRAYQKDERRMVILRRLVESAREHHEAAQSARLIFETDPLISERGDEGQAIRAHLLDIEYGWCEISEILEDRLAKLSTPTESHPSVQPGCSHKFADSNRCLKCGWSIIPEAETAASSPSSSTPTGSRPPAQGCAERATLGHAPKNPTNPEGVAPSPETA
jgi:hypothetical protein